MKSRGVLGKIEGVLNFLCEDGSIEVYTIKKKVVCSIYGTRKVNDKMDWNILWEVLKIYGAGGKLQDATK